MNDMTPEKLDQLRAEHGGHVTEIMAYRNQDGQPVMKRRYISEWVIVESEERQE